MRKAIEGDVNYEIEIYTWPASFHNEVGLLYLSVRPITVAKGHRG
jgi:hypothetical protein